MTTYHNPTTNQTATIVTVDHQTDMVAYEVGGEQVIEPWGEFIKKFSGILKNGNKTARG